MIVSDLKKSLLQYAISGKLCEQIKNDTSVDDMLISISKQKLKYKTRLNKFNNSRNQDIPFTIPNSWRWVELKDIALDIYAGGDKPKVFSKTKNTECCIPVIANGKTNDGIVGYTNIATETEKALTVAGRGTIGFSKFRKTPFTPIVRLIVIKLPDEINYKYLQKVFELLIETGVGTSIKQLTVPMIVHKLIPLPPIEEQQRIVDKMEELFAKLDEIKSIEAELNEIKNKFPCDMKKAILNEIIGKYKNNIINLGKISIINGGYAFKSTEYVKEGIRVIRISDFDEKGIKEENQVRYKYRTELEQYRLYNGNIIMCMTGGTVGKNILLKKIPNNYYANQRVATIRVNNNFLPEYIYYCINTPDIQKEIQNNKNSTNDNISMTLIKSFPIPNITLKEQQQVVDKLERLLPLCDDIEKIVNQ